MIVEDQEFLISEGELNMLSLDVFHRHSSADELLSGHYVENAETKSDTCCEQILRVLCNIHAFNGLLQIEDTDTSAIVSIVHAHGTVIRACEEEVTVTVEHDLANGTRVTRQVDWLHIELIIK